MISNGKHYFSLKKLPCNCNLINGSGNSGNKKIGRLAKTSQVHFALFQAVIPHLVTTKLPVKYAV